MRRARIKKRACGGGFTLVELVLVLVILSILATVAIEMLEPQVDQTRFETTQRALAQIETAVLGVTDQRSANSTQTLSGFVADVGREPLTLDELRIRPDTVPEFTILQSDGMPAIAPHSELKGDQELTVYGGWKGPYLQLPIGADSLTDGWGSVFDTFTPDGNPSAPTDPVAIIRSRGRTGGVGGTSYETDMFAIFEATPAAVANSVVTNAQVQNRWKNTLVVNIYEGSVGTNPTDSTSHIIVRLYGPYASDPANPETVMIGTAIHEIYGDASDTSEPIGGTPPPPVTVLLRDVFVGPRVIRAYEIDSALSPTNPDTDLSATGINTQSIRRSSSPLSINVSRTSNTIDLVLQ